MTPRLAFAVAALALFATPALAQDAAQVRLARSGESCPGCNLFQIDLSNRELRGRDFAHARLRQADLTLGVFSGARFRGADMRDVEAYGAVLTAADLRDADLTNAGLVGAVLDGADLTGAKLDGANLSGADLARARGVTRSMLARACGDQSTRTPAGTTVADCVSPAITAN